MSTKLLFIDTNILLDFYRTRTDAGRSLLRHLDAISEKIVTTYQVEMEFKKNRQHAILESFKSLKAPDKISRPGILSDHTSFKALEKDIAEASRRINILKDTMRRVFRDPVRSDPVFQVCQRVFKKTDAITLTRESPERRRIKRLALRRFLLGYPPRKKNDTSTGDAINWEWIIEVANSQKADIHIVSRDSDYGVELEKDAYVNDWLQAEFRDRVSHKRALTLSPGLSEILGEFKIPVSEEEKAEEEELIKSGREETEIHEISLEDLLR